MESKRKLKKMNKLNELNNLQQKWEKSNEIELLDKPQLITKKDYFENYEYNPKYKDMIEEIYYSHARKNRNDGFDFIEYDDFLFSDKKNFYGLIFKIDKKGDVIYIYRGTIGSDCCYNDLDGIIIWQYNYKLEVMKKLFYSCYSYSFHYVNPYYEGYIPHIIGNGKNCYLLYPYVEDVILISFYNPLIKHSILNVENLSKSVCGSEAYFIRSIKVENIKNKKLVIIKYEFEVDNKFRKKEDEDHIKTEFCYQQKLIKCPSIKDTIDKLSKKNNIWNYFTNHKLCDYKNLVNLICSYLSYYQNIEHYYLIE